MRVYFPLFLAFPFLSLFANNTHLITVQELLEPLVIGLIAGIIVTKLVKGKALLFITFAWVMFYVM